MNEWTVEKQSTRNVWELRHGSQLITTSIHYSIMQLVADAHNAEIADCLNQLMQSHEVLKRIRMRHSNNDSTIREIDAALTKVKQ